MSDDTTPDATPPTEPETPVALAEPELEPVAEPDAAVATEGEAETVADATAATDAEAPPAEASKMKWYVVKVASGREESIKAAIERMVKIEGLEVHFGKIVIPVERITEVKKVTETKNGQKTTKEKRVIKEKKKFPGYLMAEVEWTPDLQALFRDTNGVGDFVGSTGPGKEPAPMSERDVQSMLYGMQDDTGTGKPGKGPQPGGKVKIKLEFEKGDKVRIREGAFANFEGEVTAIDMPKESGETPKVTVKVMVLGRHTDIELEYWQVDKV
jgi:transcriptional antiterminator NusG